MPLRGLSAQPASVLQPVLAGEKSIEEDGMLDLPRPSLSLLLCDRAELAVRYADPVNMPTLTLHCAGLEREDQARLTDEFEAVQGRTRREGDLSRCPSPARSLRYT